MKSIITIIVSSILLSGCSNVGYILDAGMGQWRYMNRAKPVDQVMNSPHTKSQIKSAIELIQEAKTYAVEEMRLKATANYSKFVQLDEEYPTYVVTASNPLKLEAMTWSFPIVGTVPYIGFFGKDKAVNFAKKVKADESGFFQIQGKNYAPDVHVRGAPAYSTLGWFPDPIFSSMVRSSERRIVDLVIHESVHATVFIGSNIEFNERFANFIGLEGSLEFLRKKYGADSKEVEQAKSELAANKLFAEFIDRVSEEFIASVENNIEKDIELALANKDKFYANLSKRYEEIWQEAGTKFYGVVPKKWNLNFEKWNNAVLNGHRVYHADFAVMRSLFESCDQDVKRFLFWVAKEYEEKEDEFADSPDDYLKDKMLKKACPVISG